MHRKNLNALVLPAIFAATLLYFTMAELPAQDRQHVKSLLNPRSSVILARPVGLHWLAMFWID